MNFPSKLVEDAVMEVAKLPGIGKKTALRLVLFLLREEKDTTADLASALVKLREEIKYCVRCHNVSDQELCSICSNKGRDEQVICVVESITDVMAIENTSSYNGLYHVLGGVISPIEGIGPTDLNLDHLIERVKEEKTSEIILALSASMEADTTAFYITQKLSILGVKVSTIARGIPVGSDLEHTDEVTLGRSILSRVTYQTQ
ncbi:recombination mediator RecR [Sediminitomix flava]|uniref:Recombination protein RecR n=1 Tax=Sediminitomix flava TaxID=379075 RepID=A0A315Z5C4_SEDFL|nr:recombination mediator RecR [Sediminitomix flava]PWJ39108.1 DNA replication and repair protein RecR [Sediminitomix flava]